MMELLVVMTIMSIIMGIGIAFLTNTKRSSGFRSYVNQVESMARTARNFALQNHANSYLRIYVDPDNTDQVKISPVGTRVEGFWRMEEIKNGRTFGAKNMHATVSGAQLVKGKVGNGFRFDGSGQLECGIHGAFQANHGVYIEAWVKPEQFGEKQILLSKKNDYRIAIDRDGQIMFQVESEKIFSGVSLNLNQWNWVQAIFDGSFIGIRLNDQGRARRMVNIDLKPDANNPVFIGYKFIGVMDEVKLGRYVSDGNGQIPKGVKVKITPTPPKGAQVIRIPFDEKGNLDVNSNPKLATGAVIAFKKDNNVREIRISPNGIVEQVALNP